MAFVLAAETLVHRYYITSDTFLGFLGLATDVAEAKTFPTQFAAEEFAFIHCSLNGLGATYDWFVEEDASGYFSPVSIYARVPEFFDTVESLQVWLRTLFPFEYIGQVIGSEWNGISCEPHLSMHAVELCASPTPTTVSELIQLLRGYPPSWKLINFHQEGLDWHISIRYAGHQKWELGNYLERNLHGFVTLHQTIA